MHIWKNGNYQVGYIVSCRAKIKCFISKYFTGSATWQSAWVESRVSYNTKNINTNFTGVVVANNSSNIKTGRSSVSD